MKLRSEAVLAACVLVLLSGALGACSREKKLICGRDTVYREADTIGALQIPDDLSIPDSSETLRIPEAVLAVDDNPGDGCLEHSPAFSVAD